MPNDPQSKTGRARKPDFVQCPFTVVIDNNELQTNHHPYHFIGLRTNKDEGELPIVVPTIGLNLYVGDYSIFGLPRVVIERKTKEDLYGSVSRRENFEDRLEFMASLDFAAVVIEAEFSEIMRSPPKFTKYQPKSLMRTLMAWMIRYRGVHWIPMPDRWAAEQMTFRLLDRYYKDYQLQKVIPVSGIGHGLPSQ